jgi:hypothetical protein
VLKISNSIAPSFKEEPAGPAGFFEAVYDEPEILFCPAVKY